MPKHLSDVGGKVIDCGLDYLRVTAFSREQELPNILHGLKAMQDAAEDAGHKRLRFAAEGFEGETCGGWRWGVRDTITLLEASSERSQLLLEVIRNSNLACKGTRVDAAVTYLRAEHSDEWAVEMRNLVRRSERVRGIKRSLKCEIIDNPKKGNTLGCYSRSSRRYLRDYDKAAEQRHKIPVGTFRAEVEYKREMAAEMFRRVRNCTDQRFFCLDAVTEEWRRLGIDRNWDWKGLSMDMGLEVRPADQVRTAQWFIATAVPAFHKLTDPGLIAECLERLLADPATGAYKDIPEPEPAQVLAPRKPRAEVAAAARKRIKESLNIAPLGSHRHEHKCSDECGCPESLGARSAKEAEEEV